MSEDRRQAPRVEVAFETMYWIERQEGDGVVANISSSGVLLEETSVRPDPGTRVRLSVLVGQEKEVELLGAVVRHVATGFAVAFAPSCSKAAHQLLDEIVASSRSNSN